MKYLLKAWPDIQEKNRRSKILLCLDYDGTLTKIVRHPDKALLPKVRRRILAQLAQKRDLKVCVISGRMLSDVRKKVGVKQLIYVGNHGFEILGPKIKHVHPEAGAVVAVMKRIVGELRKSFQGMKGILVENKKYTLSFHYRRAQKRKHWQAREIFYKVISPFLSKGQVVVRTGKMVLEVRPVVRWNKGSAVLWLLARMMAHEERDVVPFYIGDDETDEDAFAAIRKNGVGVKVTREPGRASYASYFLKSTDGVQRFLSYMLRRDYRGK